MTRQEKIRDEATKGAVEFISLAEEKGIEIKDLFNYLETNPKFDGFLDDDMTILAYMHDEGFGDLVAFIKEEIYGKILWKEGIIFFEEPLAVKRRDWVGKHLDCDTIILDNTSSDILNVICYASNKDSNTTLFRYFKEHRESMGLLYLRGIGSNEVNKIWLTVIARMII